MKLDQAEFFDRDPVVYPYPNLLRRQGLAWGYKPRDTEFGLWLKRLALKKGTRLLEVGCGEGVFLDRVVRTYGAEGVGVDLSSQSIRRARQETLSPATFIVSDATRLPFKKEVFDAVMSFDMLEHVGQPKRGLSIAPDQKKAIREMVRVLKPGGKILIYTLNDRQKWTWNWWLSKLGVDVFTRWAHDPRLFLAPKAVCRELEKSGAEVEDQAFYNAFFSLIADELVMGATVLLRKIGWGDDQTGSGQRMGRTFLKLANWFSRVSRSVFKLAEGPWFTRGYANSFFVLARKK